MTGLRSRTKGLRAEQELANLLREITGQDVRRRVRQHRGDSDLEGLPGWAIECKRACKADNALLRSWWRQACAQAAKEEAFPLLIYRLDRQGWRAVWHAAMHCAERHRGKLDFEGTLHAGLLTWWLMVKAMPLSEAKQPIANAET